MNTAVVSSRSQTPMTRIIFFGFLCIILLACTAGWVLYMRTEKMSTDTDIVKKLTARLKTDTVQEYIYIGRGGVLVKDGTAYGTHGSEFAPHETLEALQTAYVTAYARTAPLFGTPGNDPESLLAATEALDHAQQELAHWEANPEYARAIQEALYPTSFLRALAHTEAARRALLAEPSHATRETYLSELSDALSAGSHDAVRLQDTLTKLLPDDGRLYASVGHTFRIRDMHTAVTALRAAFVLKTREYEQLHACLYDRTAPCAAIKSVGPPLAEFSRETSSLPPSVLALESFFSSANNRPPRDNEYFVALQKSTCLPKEAPPLYFSVWKTLPDGAPTFSIKYRNDLFFSPIGTSTEESLARYVASASSTTYLHLNPTMFYMCPEIAHDLGRAHILDSIASFAHIHPTIAPLARAHLLANRELIREDSAYQYLAEAYATVTKEDPSYTALQELLLEAHTLSGGLDGLVGEIARITSRQAQFRERGIPGVSDARTLFLTRSAFPSLFLTHNPLSVSAPSYTTPFTESNLPLSAKNILRYTTLIQTVSKEKLAADLFAVLSVEGDVFPAN